MEYDDKALIDILAAQRNNAQNDGAAAWAVVARLKKENAAQAGEIKALKAKVPKTKGKKA